MRGYLSGNNYSVLVTSVAPPWVSRQNTKGHFRAGNTSYLGFCQKSATFGYQLVSSRYPAAKSHTGGHFTRLDSLDRNFILKKIYRASRVEWSKIGAKTAITRRARPHSTLRKLPCHNIGHPPCMKCRQVLHSVARFGKGRFEIS